MIQERVRAGLARAKDEGKTLGRPKIDPATEKAIRAALSKGDTGMHKSRLSSVSAPARSSGLGQRWRRDAFAPPHHKARHDCDHLFTQAESGRQLSRQECRRRLTQIRPTRGKTRHACRCVYC
jgi:hypothetical protein